MVYYVYALWSASHKRLYIGMTTDVEKRLKQHNQGLTRSTKFYKPWKIIAVTEFSDRKRAREGELHWKKGFIREKLRSLALKGEFNVQDESF